MPRTTRSTSASASNKGARARFATLAALAAFAMSPVLARADGPSLDCPSSSEEGQRLRDKNKYLDAREMFRACSQASCPAIVRKDCSKWLAEIEESMPSLVIAAQDESGRDLADVRVQVDGLLVASRITGSPIAVDPGEHVLRVEAADRTPFEQRLIVRVNEKNRLVRVVLGDPRAKEKPNEEPKEKPVAPPEASGTPVLGFIVAGVGVAALGSFAFFGLTSKNDLQGLRSDCAPYCEQGKLDDVKTKMLVADVSLGVGIVALIAGGILIATHGPSKPVTSARR